MTDYKAALAAAAMRERAADCFAKHPCVRMAQWDRAGSWRHDVHAAILAIPLPGDPLPAALELPEVRALILAAWKVHYRATGATLEIRKALKAFPPAAALKGETT